MTSDVVIVGSGPAGLTASIYLARQNKKVVIIYKDRGALDKAHDIDNYFGFNEAVPGPKLLDDTIAKAKALGVEFIEDEAVGINYSETLEVRALKDTYAAPYIILATGVSRAKPKILGLDKFLYKGISYCATCDGYQYKDKTVAVLGNSHYALHEAMELANIASKVYVLSNKLKVDVDIPSKMIHVGAKITEITGGDFVDGVSFEDGTHIDVDGVFVALNTSGATDLAKTIGASTSDKFILTNQNQETDIPGLYAAGDCTSAPYQIAKANYEGMMAAYDILEKMKEASK